MPEQRRSPILATSNERPFNMYVSFLTVRIAKMGMCALELSYDTEEPREHVQAIRG